MAGFVDMVRTLGSARLSAIGGTALLLIGFFLYIMTRMSSPNMQLLYADLDVQDSSKIVAELEQQNIPHQVRSDGRQIYVPESQVGTLRVKLAGEGIPGGGSVGYEIFDKSEGFGASSFMLNVKHVRALEGELARSIRAISNVAGARVHLVLPQRELFSRETQAASSSVVLKLRRPLERAQIAAIQHLVAAAVPQLQPSQVVVIDDRGNMLAAGFEDANGAGAMLQNGAELRQATEARLSNAIEQLLARSLGNGNSKVQVSAELNMQRVVTNRENYDPESKVERSTQSSSENSQDSTKEGAGAVGASGNLPATAGANAGQNNQSSQTKRGSETVNYEISKVVTSETSEAGQIKRLSIAVLVNNKQVKKEEPKKDDAKKDDTKKDAAKEEAGFTSEPRSAEELKQLEELVKTAAGFDEKRGDTVKVINLPFGVVAEDIPEEKTTVFGFTKQDIKDLLELVLLSVVALLVLLLVVRPFLARIMQVPQVDQNAMIGVAGQMLQPAAMMAALGAPQTAAGSTALPGAMHAMPALPDNFDDSTEMVNLSKVTGKVKGGVVRQIGDLVDKNTDDSVSVIRGWMSQDNNAY
jgi:flagellar M-ring protein FliF